MLGRRLEPAGLGSWPPWSPGHPASSRSPGSLQPHPKAFLHWARRGGRHRAGRMFARWLPENRAQSPLPLCLAMEEGLGLGLSRLQKQVTDARAGQEKVQT